MLILRPPDANSRLIEKNSDAGKDWRQEEKGKTEDETVGWHHRLEFEQARGVGDGQGNLACCRWWGHKESDTTEWLNSTEPNVHVSIYDRSSYVELLDQKIGPTLLNSFPRLYQVTLPNVHVSSFDLHIWQHSVPVWYRYISISWCPLISTEGTRCCISFLVTYFLLCEVLIQTFWFFYTWSFSSPFFF